MIPDIELDECIEMVTAWLKNANDWYKKTGDFQFVIEAHRFKEIVRHLKDYKELKEKENGVHDNKNAK